MGMRVKMLLKTKYKYLLVSDPEGDSSTFTSDAQMLRWCPKLTRFKAAAVVIILFLFVLLISYVGLSPGGSQVTGLTSMTTSNVSGQKQLAKVDETIRQSGNYAGVDDSDKIRYRHTKRQLPQCIIIGSRKSGTRALLTFLDIHPDIRVAKEEIHFFDEQENYDRGYEWYRKRMPFTFPGQITIEKTPAYFVADFVPERVQMMNKSIKLLLIVRDPVDRAVSDYLQILDNKRRKGKEFVPFEELAITAEGEVNESYNAIKRSLYYKHMKVWLRFFHMDQILVLSGEGLVNEPASELVRVEQFLGLQHKITKENFYLNETRGFYCIRTETEERCLAQSKGRQHPDMNPLVINKLRSYFRPFNRRFYRQVGRDFGWP